MAAPSKASKKEKTTAIKDVLFHVVKSELSKLSLTDEKDQIDEFLEYAFRHEESIKPDFGGNPLFQKSALEALYPGTLEDNLGFDEVMDKLNDPCCKPEDFELAVMALGTRTIHLLQSSYTKNFVNHNYLGKLIEQQEECEKLERRLFSFYMNQGNEDIEKPTAEEQKTAQKDKALIMEALRTRKEYLQALQKIVFVTNGYLQDASNQDYFTDLVKNIMTVENAIEATPPGSSPLRTSANLHTSVRTLVQVQGRDVDVGEWARREAISKGIAAKEAYAACKNKLSLLNVNFDTKNCEEWLINPFEKKLAQLQGLPDYKSAPQKELYVLKQPSHLSDSDMKKKVEALKGTLRQVEEKLTKGLSSKVYLLSEKMQGILRLLKHKANIILDMEEKELKFIDKVKIFFRQKFSGIDPKNRAMSYMNFYRMMEKEGLSVDTDRLAKLRFENFMHEVDPNNVQQLSFKNFKKFRDNLQKCKLKSGKNAWENMKKWDVSMDLIDFKDIPKTKDMPNTMVKVPGSRAISMHAITLHYRLLMLKEHFDELLKEIPQENQEEQKRNGAILKILSKIAQLKEYYESEAEKQAKGMDAEIRTKYEEKEELEKEIKEFQVQRILLKQEDPKGNKNTIKTLDKQISKKIKTLKSLKSSIHRLNKKFRSKTSALTQALKGIMPKLPQYFLLPFEKAKFPSILNRDNRAKDNRFIAIMSHLQHNKPIDPDKSSVHVLNTIHKELVGENHSKDIPGTLDFRKIIKQLTPKKMTGDSDSLEARLKAGYTEDVKSRLQGMRVDLESQSNICEQILKVLDPQSTEYKIVLAKQDYIQSLIQTVADTGIEHIVSEVLAKKDEQSQKISFSSKIASDLLNFSSGFQDNKVFKLFADKQAIPPQDFLENVFEKLVQEKEKDTNLEETQHKYKTALNEYPEMDVFFKKNPLERTDANLNQEELMDLILLVLSSYYQHGQSLEDTVGKITKKQVPIRIQALLKKAAGHIPFPIVKDIVGSDRVTNHLTRWISPIFIAGVPNFVDFVGYLKGKIYGMLDMEVQVKVRELACNYAKAVNNNITPTNKDTDAFMMLYTYFDILTRNRKTQEPDETQEKNIIRVIYRNFTSNDDRDPKKTEEAVELLHTAFQKTREQLNERLDNEPQTTPELEVDRRELENPPAFSTMNALMSALNYADLNQDKETQRLMQDLVYTKIKMQLKSEHNDLRNEAKQAFEELFKRRHKFFMANISQQPHSQVTPEQTTREHSQQDTLSDYDEEQDNSLLSEKSFISQKSLLSDVDGSFRLMKHDDQSLSQISTDSGLFSFDDMNIHLLDVSYRMLDSIENVFLTIKDKDPVSAEKFKDRITGLYHDLEKENKIGLSMEKYQTNLKLGLLNIAKESINELIETKDIPLSKQQKESTIAELNQLKNDVLHMTQHDLAATFQANIQGKRLETTFDKAFEEEFFDHNKFVVEETPKVYGSQRLKKHVSDLKNPNEIDIKSHYKR